MKITKKSNKKDRINSNNKIKNFEYKNNLIKNKDKEIKRNLSMSINNIGDYINNINNGKEINEIANKENKILFKEIKNEFSNINKKLDEIIYRFKLFDKSLYFVENQDNFFICPNPSENTVIQRIIDNFFISRIYKEENRIQSIESFELIGKEINKKNNYDKNSKLNSLPIISKKIVFQIKRTEELEILQKKNSKNKNYKKNQLPIIKKPLKSQLIENFFIPSINQKEFQIQNKEELELVRIYIPIPDYVIEKNKDFQIYPLEKNPLIIQYNNKIEYISKK